MAITTIGYTTMVLSPHSERSESITMSLEGKTSCTSDRDHSPHMLICGFRLKALASAPSLFDIARILKDYHKPVSRARASFLWLTHLPKCRGFRGIPQKLQVRNTIRLYNEFSFFNNCRKFECVAPYGCCQARTVVRNSSATDKRP
jgi:hypothetical protein